MHDPLLLQLVQLAESFAGSERLELPIAIQVNGTRFSGVLIGSNDFLRLLEQSPVHAQIRNILERPRRSIQPLQDGADYLHLLGTDGADPTSVGWRFRLDAVDGFTLGCIGVPAARAVV